MLYSISLVLSFLTSTQCTEPQPEKNTKKASITVMNATEIIPGKSIGRVRLGSPISELSGQTTISGIIGELDGIKFLIANDKIDDVWIDDLRKFSGEVRFQGKVIARDVPLEKLKDTFGPCERVDVKGGVFFNCSTGITIGCDFDARGDFIQLRLKPR
jgi:hypothetical protein